MSEDLPSWYSDEQKAQLRALRRERATAVDPREKPFRAAGAETWIALALYVGALAWIGFGWVLPLLSGAVPSTRAQQVGSVYFMLTVMVLGQVPIWVFFIRNPKAAMSRLEDIDARIEEFTSQARAGRRRSGGAGEYLTTRQAQHQWYSGHADLDWRDRETAEMYGMDADTYINNVRDHDRD